MNKVLNNVTNEQLILKYRKLVPYVAWKLLPNISTNSNYEELISEGTVGLVKAANTFDFSKNTTFSTYAIKCITNEIFMYLRQVNKHKYNISFSSPVFVTKNENTITLEDTLEDTNFNLEEQAINKELFTELINIILNFEKYQNKIVFLYSLGNFSQKEISQRFNLSQGYISRILKKTTSDIKTYFTNNTPYKKNISFKICGTSYLFSFSIKNIDEKNLIRKLKKTSCNFLYNSKRKSITIILPRNFRSFSFIAELLMQVNEKNF